MLKAKITYVDDPISSRTIMKVDGKPVCKPQGRWLNLRSKPADRIQRIIEIATPSDCFVLDYNIILDPDDQNRGEIELFLDRITL